MNRYINLKQILRPVKTHLYVSLAATLIGLITASILAGDITKYIFSGVFIFIYMLTMYSTAEDIAHHDRQSFSVETAFAAKGIFLTLGIYAVGIFLYILYHLTWKYNIIDTSSGFINNALFVIWTFVYNGFMDLNSGEFNAYAAVLFAVAPMLGLCAGYYAGYKKFDLSEKVAKIVYESKEAEENDMGEDGNV